MLLSYYLFVSIVIIKDRHPSKSLWFRRRHRSRTVKIASFVERELFNDNTAAGRAPEARVYARIINIRSKTAVRNNIIIIIYPTKQYNIL